MNDFVRRFCTVAVGAPIAILLLSNSGSAAVLIALCHILCAVEWTQMLPRFTSLNNYHKSTSTKGKNQKFYQAPQHAILMFPFLSILVGLSTRPFVTLSLSSTFLMLSNYVNEGDRIVKDDDQANDYEARKFVISQHCQFGLLFVSIGFYHLHLISSISFTHTMMFILIVWNCDTGALLTGKTFGMLNYGDPMASFLPRKAKICLNSISPNKTITGMAGGLIFGTATAIFLPDLILSSCKWFSFQMRDMCNDNNDYLNYNAVSFIQNLTMRRAFVGFVLSTAGEIGDLVESSVKRRACVKDSGKLLPGQGGMLDRMDSALLSSIIYVWCLM